MEAHSLLGGSRDHQLTRCRFPEPVDGDDEVDVSDEALEVRRRRRTKEGLTLPELCAMPWFGWLFVYAFVLFCFSVARCLTLPALVEMYGSPRDYTLGFKTAALGLGFLEDFVCATYFVYALWLFDAVKRRAVERLGEKDRVATGLVANIATFAVSWLLFFAMAAPFLADLMLVANRNMRFTFDLVAALIRERHHLNAAPISLDELQRGYMGAVALVVVAALFASVRMWAGWADLSTWNPTHVVAGLGDSRTRIDSVSGIKYTELTLEEGTESPATPMAGEDAGFEKTSSDRALIFRHFVRLAFVVVGLAVVPAMVVAIRCACSPLVAYSGLNATVNELFSHALQPTPTDAMLTNVKGDQPWVETFIHPTETHKLFGNDTLYRRTTGFEGDLAFDVDISTENPPNVLVIGVESFRYQDSRYLVGEKDPSNLFKGTNLTITPNFDRWAKRGVALRNMWSSNPTSRSLESLLFAQVPYDSALFKQKGYETQFTTGSSITLNNWNVFLPTHGFDSVWEAKTHLILGEKHLKIKRSQWFGDEHRAFNWGVHDDLSFRLLGDLLVHKTNKQKARLAKGKPKKPLFITHYTISSHHPFKARPMWYDEADKPDFSALYEGEEHAEDIKNYLEMRYFTDMQLGKFMDRMEEKGLLNDTIVVIMGDHGQAPEADIMNTHEESVTRVAGAIIAEGRLGDAAGLKIEDAAEQYDILNTLADMTGLPEGGFVQTGVGRSLKRKATFGQRPVYSNDPNRKMAIVRGRHRLRYDRVTDSVLLHDTESDYAMTTDLFPELPAEKQAKWLAWRDSGRRIAAYYKQRWDDKCLLAVDCNAEN
ncbi:hypothetical protein PF002_g5733 [Phytophthora fragariae]|uniref:Sulfatase N-terminal domain-containing protein n=2 Tax=Phytophthora fragariae TaxID=53985 RepID=A0A6A4A5M5_9STRA|nr:hypothetical protein PF011_g15789 [Phytophthora fragariae]KAE9248570.1 hypothetical protein PF002_g5733 [Phytophthora fragariae]